MTNWSGGGYGGPNPVGPGGPDPRQPNQGPGSGPWQGGPPPASWSAPQPPPQPWAPGGPRPAPGYAGPGSYGAPPPPGPGPGRNRKPLLITLGAGAAVLVVIVIVLVVTLAGGDDSRGGGGSAADAVKGYLEALARGDAESALSYSEDQPASKDFLTDDVLKKQIAKWPITNIRILNDDSSASGIGFGQVHVAANFGDKVSDATLTAKRSNKRWYLDAAAMKLQATPGGSVNAAAQTVTLFGKPLTGGTSYVFPGYLDIASSNPYVAVKAKPLLLESLNSTGAWIQGDYSLNDAGTKAVNDAVTAAFAACQQSNSLKPPAPCPLGLAQDEYVEGTAHWGAADISDFKVSVFDQFHMSVMFTGKAIVPVTVQSKSGRAGDGTLTKYLIGDADISKTPPALSYH